MNRGKQRNNTSGYKGVSWSKRDRKWRSNIKFEGKIYWIGYFASKEEAYVAYCKRAKQMHGEYWHP